MSEAQTSPLLYRLLADPDRRDPPPGLFRSYSRSSRLVSRYNEELDDFGLSIATVRLPGDLPIRCKL